MTSLSFVLGGVFVDVPISLSIKGKQKLGVVTTDWELPIGDFVIKIDPVAGLIVIFIVIIVIAGLLGIQILASGLSPESVRFIMNAILYFAIWSLLSIPCFNLIISIEIFGTLIYIVLTIAYVIGVIQKIGGGNG
ncbi:unnamed protein product [marine sediment metagenome]|uniref:Yip1 domain-containing protein n=1 Tax=marine sediment metagenome TaxID=412755 RepID=X1I580_9ZZZZ